MDAGKAVAQLEHRLVEAVNQSGLPPVVVRLVLLNLLHAVQDQEREQAQSGPGKEETDG